MRRPIAATLALALTASAVTAARAADYDPRTVFRLSAHAIIDDRCGDARAFADRAGTSLDGIAPADAVDAAKAFIACSQMRRLNQDADENRYYLLAAAAALYVAGSKTSPGTTVKLDGNADGIAQQLGGAQPDPMYSFVKVEGGSAGGGHSTASDDQNDANVSHAADNDKHGNVTWTSADRNVFHGSEGPAFANEASDLRIAIAKAVGIAKAGAEASAAASPAPATTSLPAR